MGRVLIQFDPEYFLDKEKVTDPKDREILLKEVFHSPYWKQMDEGKLDETEMYEKIIDKIPDHLHDIAERLQFHWWEPLLPVEGMEELVRALKKKGYGIYLLSNASVSQKLYWPSFSCSGCFDGVIVSAFEKCIKPDPRIYQILLERYDLKPEECIFIDDAPANIEAAERLGITGHLFINADTLIQFLKKEGIL